jgi:hypothetical protein
MEQVEGAMAAVFRAHLSALGAELRGARRQSLVRATLDELMRLQAVLVADGGSAAACLDGVVAEDDGADRDLLCGLASDLFARHRRQIESIRAGEISRAGFVARRASLSAKQKLRPTSGRSEGRTTREEREGRPTPATCPAPADQGDD